MGQFRAILRSHAVAAGLNNHRDRSVSIGSVRRIPDDRRDVSARARSLALFDLGRTMARRAVCSICLTEKNEVKHRSVVDADVCPACYNRLLRPRYRCALCGRIAIATTWLDDQRPVCSECFRKHVNLAKCVVCKRKQAVRARDSFGRPLCEACHSATNRERVRCAGCGKTAVPKVTFDDDRTYCAACYRRELQPREECRFCRRVRVVSHRDRRGRPCCPSCYQREILRAVCSVCGGFESVLKRGRRGQPICQRCNIQPKATCSRCGALRNVGARDSVDRPICRRCHRAAKRAVCTYCGRKSPVFGQIERAPYCVRCFRREKRVREASL